MTVDYCVLKQVIALITIAVLEIVSLLEQISKNTGAGCHSLLQGIFPIQESNQGLLYWQVDSLLTEPPGSPRYMVSWNWLSKCILSLEKRIRDFSGHPVVKTPCCYCRRRVRSQVGELRSCIPGAQKKRIRNSSHPHGTDSNIHLVSCWGMFTVLLSVKILVWRDLDHGNSPQALHWSVILISCWSGRISKDRALKQVLPAEQTVPHLDHPIQPTLCCWWSQWRQGGSVEPMASPSAWITRQSSGILGQVMPSTADMYTPLKKALLACHWALVENSWALGTKCRTAKYELGSFGPRHKSKWIQQRSI